MKIDLNFTGSKEYNVIISTSPIGNICFILILRVHRAMGNFSLELELRVE